MPARTPAQPSPRKAALWFGLALYANSALLLLATPVFTRLMSRDEFGQVVLYNAWLSVVTIVASLSLARGVFNNGLLEHEQRIDAYMTSMVGLTVVCNAAVFVLLAAAVALFGDFTGLGVPLLALMLLFIPLNAVYLFWQARQRFHYLYRLPVLLSAVTALLGVGGAIAAMLLLPAWRVEARVLAVAIPTMLIGAVMLVALLRHRHTLFDAVGWRVALGMGLVLLPHYAAQGLLQNFDRFAVSRLLDTAALGVYGLALAVASAVTLFWTAISAAWGPWLLRQLKNDALGALSASALWITAGVGAVAVALALVAPELVRLLSPAPYHAAAVLVPWLALASYFQFAQSVFMSVHFYRKRALFITLASLAATALIVVLNLALVGRHGLLGAAWAAIAAQVLQLGLHMAAIRGFRETAMRGWRGMLAVSAAVSLAIAGCALLQHEPLARGALLLALLVAVGFAWRRWHATAAPA